MNDYNPDHTSNPGLFRTQVSDSLPEGVAARVATEKQLVWLMDDGRVLTHDIIDPEELKRGKG